MGEYLVKWKASKDMFERTTKVKKPAPTIAKIRVGTGIETALKAVETAHAPFDNPQLVKTDKHVVAMEKAVAAFSVTKNKYLVTLEEAAKKESAGTDQAVYLKGIKVLSSELKALEAELKLQAGYAKSAVANEGVTAGLAKNLLASTDASTRRAMAFVAKVKAEPDVKYFNDNIMKITRDINQSIGNIDKLTQKGYKFAHEQPNNLWEVIRPWADGSRKLKPNATTAEVLRENGALEQAVKGVRAWLKSA